MESKLIVKNFGPIKHADLDLRNVNVFIGPQATGKSALAKLYTIFKAPRKFFFKNDSNKNDTLILDGEKTIREFKEVLEEYNITSFLKPNTEIHFDSELHTISYKDNTIKYEPKLLKKIEALQILATDFLKNRSTLINEFDALAHKFVFFDFRARESLKKTNQPREIVLDFNNLNENNYQIVIDIIKSIEKDLSTNTAFYIPAERNFSNIIKKSALNLILNKAPIPKHILSFGAELEKLEIKEIELSFIQQGLAYKVINGNDRIYINNNDSITLTEAASGVQSVIPILMPILSRNLNSHRSFVIEEPELNLFPIAQYKLIQVLESTRIDPYWEDFGSIHTYTTHSPYILSALNNLLYAYKVKDELNKRELSNNKNIHPIDRQAIAQNNDSIVKKIVTAAINPNSFTAYQINNGHAISIFDRETGLIKENYIDDASDTINDDFEALMELIK